MPRIYRLIYAREVRNWKRPDLARALRRLSKERGSPLGTAPSGVLRWEEEGRRPDGLTQRLLAELFGIDPALVAIHPWPHWLDFDPLQQCADFPWTPRGALDALKDTVGSSYMHRRSFIFSSAALTSSLLSWLTADPAAAGELASGRRIGASAVTAIERRVRELRQTDDEDGGGTLLSQTTAVKDVVTDLLENRSYSLAHERRLFGAAADLERMRAWAMFDVDGVCDDRVFQAALHAAHSADDPALGAHILTFWAAAAYNCDRPTDAETLASTALGAVRGRAAPRVEALVYARRARARSHLKAPGCWSDLDQAERHLHQADLSPGEEPEWAYWFDHSEFQGSRASSQLTMGRAQDAEATFAAAAKAFDGSAVRTHALYLARQADAQLQQGHLEAACSTAHQALDLTDQISSHRTVAPLQDLARAMYGHQHIAAVRDLRERIATVG
ncbi:helix-turn-helix transcriptional regulator [Streptomyces montanus]|uniref:Helix-turn-helix transcriptional regulator n=1 Tax=Streptomyces montanus TaxID=2580423 RepID=A0A5R9FZB7_9ACTN|nr:helix-turn-helix transcriptional regulator [Streptomyces montanus]TLS46083.1 helix-turn-helix transcriptional regulator [Streptomyces montanus]